MPGTVDTRRRVASSGDALSTTTISRGSVVRARSDARQRSSAAGRSRVQTTTETSVAAGESTAHAGLRIGFARAGCTAASGHSLASSAAASPCRRGSGDSAGSGASKSSAKRRAPTAGATAWLASAASAAVERGSASGVTSHRPSGTPASQKKRWTPAPSGSAATTGSGAPRSTCRTRQGPEG
jgi:hypothetical protein